MVPSASALLVLGCASVLSAAGIEPTGDLPWIATQGPRLVALAADGAASPFTPVGIGYCRDVIIKAQDEAVMRFARAHHLNTVRLAFYTRRFNNDPARPIDLDAHLASHCDPVLAAARRERLYVILDDHAYFSAPVDEGTARQAQAARHWSEAEVQEWIDRWVRVAQRYRDDPTVLAYELCNEPHDLPPETVRDWYTRCMRAIRQVDQRHLLIVGTADWSHARALEPTWGATATTVDAPYNRGVFAFHDYPKDDEPWMVRQHATAFRARHQVPVLCTEFGATWWSNDETTCRAFQAGMLAVFAHEDIGWMVWALKYLEDNPRNAHPLPRGAATTAAVRVPAPPYDSCAYSDLWTPVARIMATPVAAAGAER